MAVALDLLGERWTLLIVRNLLRGPKRFTDLEDGLVGVGTGLLSKRLRHLQDIGVIEKATLPPPAASTVYQLTSEGERLRPIVLALARWGLDRLGPPGKDVLVSPEMAMIAMEARFEPSLARGLDGVYQLTVDDQPFRVEIRESALTIRAGTAEDSRAAVTTDSRTLAELNSGVTTVLDASAAGRLIITGDTHGAWALIPAFGLG